MKRRTILQTTVSAGIIGLSGCSRIKCAIDGNYDRLELAEIPDDVATSSDSIIVNYDKLSTSAQRAVRKAASDGEYRECHEFGEEQSTIETLRDQISARWERSDGDGTPKGERTYLRYDGDYYGIDLGILDGQFMNSIPKR